MGPRQPANGAARLLERSGADVQALDTIDPTRAYARVSGDGEALPGDPAPGLDIGFTWEAAWPRSLPRG